MKKNIDNVVLTEDDLIAINESKHICLLRQGEVYKINASLPEIIKNPENVSIQYMHKLCTKCDDDKNKKFLPLKVIKEVYEIINKKYEEDVKK